MSDFGFPILYALGLWWFSTGVVLYLDNLPGRTFRWTMMAGIGVLALAVFGLVVSSTSTGKFAEYAAFSCGVIVWGVIEMSYFTGFVTGPRKAPCPQGCSDLRRFGLAIMTSLYHELLVIGTALFLVVVSWGEPNPIGAWTFVVLWLMRWSAKLNLFFGVPNLNEDWLPEDIRYLKTYMSQRGMNFLFPVSVTLATVVVVLIVLQAISAPASGAYSVGLMLVATLMSLGILEHWFLVLPLPDEALWAWALPPRAHDDDAPGQPRDESDSAKLCSISQRPSIRTTRSSAPANGRRPEQRARIGVVTKVSEAPSTLVCAER